MLQLQGLVLVQVTLAFVLLIGAGLVIKTLVRLQRVTSASTRHGSSA